MKFIRRILRPAWHSIKRRYYKVRYGKNIYLVYTMGKVGTSTISAFFKRYHPELISFHLHFLSDHWVKGVLPKLPVFFHSNIELAENTLEFISKRPHHRLKVITMVREPLSREISDIFQNWKGIFKVNDVNELLPAELFKYLNEHKHVNTLTWFDTEFNGYLNFDIYTIPFDKEKGYTIYRTEKADILCIKMEKMNDCIRQAMREFTGMKMILPDIANRSENKEGNELYKLLREQYKIPSEKLSYIYDSKYVKHFYTDKEIGNFINKWTRGEFESIDLDS